MVTFLTICLLIMPWIFIPNINIVDQMRLPQSMFMDVIFMGIISWSFYQGQKYVYRNKYLSWLIGYIFLSFVFHFFLPYGTDIRNMGRSINLWTLEPMIHLFLGFWAVSIILCNFEREDFIRIAKALCISACAISVFAICQFLGWNSFGTISTNYLCANNVSACLDNPNLVGNYLVLCLPMFFMFRNKYIFGSLLVILAILACKSHFSIFLAILTIFIYLFLNYRKNKWVILSLVSVFVGICIYLLKIDFAKTGLRMSYRLDVWHISRIYFKNNPLFGSGMGVWKTLNIYINNTVWTCAHSDWLERLVELGIVGVSLIILVIINTFRRINLKEYTNYSFITSFVVFLVMCLGSFPFETATIALPAILCWCAVEKY